MRSGTEGHTLDGIPEFCKKEQKNSLLSVMCEITISCD